jgi:hypothetical protein
MGTVVVVMIGYYYLLVPRLGGIWSRWMLQVAESRFAFVARYSADEMDKMLRLLAAAILQLALCGGLILLSGVHLRQLIPGRPGPALLIYGIPLGIGEAMLGSFFGEVAMRTAIQIAPGRVPSQPRDWLAMLRGGWMSLFVRTAERAPLGLLSGLLLLYVGTEEVIFRGILLTGFSPLGSVAAFFISLLLFLMVQIFYMPSWQSTIFPVMGALVIGVVHGLLYLVVPDLGPLIVAHLVFLLTSLL